MFSVLVVDDEPLVSKGIRLILESSDLPIDDIMEAEDGSQALELLQEKNVNILITDIRMPKMDGLELCRKVYNKCPTMSIIILSGYGDFKYAQESIKYGVKDYLLKPFRRADIVGTVSKVIDEQKASGKMLYIGQNNIDSIVDNIYLGIWENQEEKIREGLMELSGITNDMRLDHCLQFQKDLTGLILGRLSMKLGYELRIEFEEYKGNKKDELPELFANLVAHLRKEIDERRASTNYNLFLMARDYIKENYTDDFSLEDLAKKTGYSTNYFSHLFKSNTGKSFVQYRSDLRMEKAKELLLRPNMSITETALEVGYSDVTYFIRAFKKYTGVTPKAFTKKKGQNHEKQIQ